MLGQKPADIVVSKIGDDAASVRDLGQFALRVVDGRARVGLVRWITLPKPLRTKPVLSERGSL